MIKPLRKRHLQIWALLAVLLPAGIISAWFAIPEQPSYKLLQPIATGALPVVLKLIDKENYTVSIKSSNDTSQLQLEWVNKKTLTFPTATIYRVAAGSDDIKNGQLIGRIETRGTYYFKLDSTFRLINPPAFQLLLYDFIHQKNIDTIKF